MTTAMKLLQRSAQADAVHFEALRAVDRAGWRGWPDSPQSVEAQAAIYRAAAGSACHARGLEELEPTNKALARLAAISIICPAVVPPQIVEMREAIVGRWRAVYRELVPDSD